MTLLEIVESITSEGLEQRIAEALAAGKKGAFIQTQMQLISWWLWSDSERLQVRFVLVNPAGERIVSQPTESEVSDKVFSLRMLVKIDRFPVTALGLHWYFVEYQVSGEWVTVTKIPFSIGTT